LAAYPTQIAPLTIDQASKGIKKHRKHEMESERISEKPMLSVGVGFLVAKTAKNRFEMPPPPLEPIRKIGNEYHESGYSQGKKDY
jgi:hypothetical protein